MGTNGLLKIIAVFVFALAVLAGIKACSKPSPTVSGSGQLDAAAEKVGGETLSADERALYDLADTGKADGDTPQDTLATVVAEKRALRAKVDEQTKISSDLAKKADRLLDMERSIEQRVTAKLKNQTDDLEQRSEEADKRTRDAIALVQEFEKKMKGITESYTKSPKTLDAQQPRTGAAGDIPVGLGYSGAGSSPALIGSASMPAGDGVTWIAPLDQISSSSVAAPLNASAAKISDSAAATPSFPAPVDAKGWLNLSKVTNSSGTLPGGVAKEIPVEKVYTINRDATLIGSVGMTALIGRIPVKGAVQDPYPFKILVGAENLAANGIHIPGIESMVMSGTATGDLNLSCVSGKIYSATFVFKDGTIRSFPKPEGGDKPSGTSGSSRKTFGYISDRFGTPCVTGKLITNAPEYLATRAGLAGLEAWGEAYAASETTTYGSGLTGGTVTSVTGDRNNYAKGRAFSDGISESIAWLRERQGLSFDAIFVRNGVDVAIHIEDEIPIDYDPTGRKVRHQSALAATASQKTNLD